MTFIDVVNELKLQRTSLLESRIESAEDFKVQLAQMDVQNNILSDIRRSVVAMAGVMEARSSSLAEALAEQNRLSEDAALRERLAAEGKDKEKVVEAKPVVEKKDQEPVGGLLGKLLGLIKGVVLGGVAAVLGSELWLALRGITDGTAYESLSKKFKGLAAGILIVSGVVGKVAKSFKAGAVAAFTRLGAGIAKLGKAVGTVVRTVASVAKPFLGLVRAFGPLLRVIPGIGQALMFLTAAFDGIKAGIEKFREGGNAFEIALAVVQGALMSVVDGFVSLGEMLYNLLPESWRTNIEAAWNMFADAFDSLVDMIMDISTWIGRKINQVGDLLGTSDAERERNEKRQEITRLRSSMSGHRGRRLTDEQRAQKQEELNQAQAELLELQRAVANEDSREYVAPSERNSRARNVGELSDRVSQLERQSMVVAPVFATDASQSNTNIQTNNTMVSGVLRPEYDGISGY